MAHESDLRKNKEKYVHIQTCAGGVENQSGSLTDPRGVVGPFTFDQAP